MARHARFLCIILLLALAGPLLAQDDALNLPAALYVLSNDGAVQRYGVGAEGVRSVTPEGAFIVDFGVAPDDRWLAYRTDTGLFITDMYAGEPVEVAGAEADGPPFRGRGDTIAWSPDGAVIATTTAYGARVYSAADGGYSAAELREGAFVQLMWSPGGRYLVGETEEGIWWLYRREGGQIALTSVITAATSTAWINSDEIAFAPVEGGLVLMSLNRANTQTVLLDSTATYALPQMLPDGGLGVFARQRDDTAVPEGFGRLVALRPGAAQLDSLSDAPVELADLRWTPGGRLAVRFQGGVFALVDPTSGQGFALPIGGAVAYTWGPVPPAAVIGIELPADGFFMAPAGGGPVQVWRMPADGEAPFPITAEENGVSSFAIAPDGQRIAYSSGSRLMQLRLGETEAEQIATLSASGPAHPAFGPDGQRVAWIDGGVWLAQLSGGDARLLAAGDFSAPAFAPNLDALLTMAADPDGPRPTLIDLTTGEAIPLGAAGQAARWLPDGRVALYGGRTGLSVVSVDGQAQALLPPPIAVEAVGPVSANRLRLSLPERATGPAPLRLAEIDPSTGAIAPVYNGAFLLAPAFAPDGSFVAGYRYRTADPNPGGPLTLLDLSSGRQVTLTEPPLVWNFTWTQR